MAMRSFLRVHNDSRIQKYIAYSTLTLVHISKQIIIYTYTTKRTLHIRKLYSLEFIQKCMSILMRGRE